MSDRDKILQKIVFYFVSPVVLVLVCVLIYLLIKNHVCAREETQELEQKRLQEAQEVQEKELRDQKLEAQRIQEEKRRAQEAREKEQKARIAREKAREEQRRNQEFIEKLPPKVTSKGLLDKIREEHRQIPIDKSTSDSLAEIQLSGHEAERYIEQRTLEQIKGQEDIIGTLQAYLDQRLYLGRHPLLLVFLDRMKTFNFLEFIGEDHQFDPNIAKNYVGDFFKECDILCDKRYYTGVYDTIQLQFIDIKFIDALRFLRHFLQIIYTNTYWDVEGILNFAHKYCYIFFNKIPKLLNWDKNNNAQALKEEFTMVEIQYSLNDIRFYCVGGMNSAVIHWQSILNIRFDPERVCRTFDSLVVLGRLHLKYINKSDMDKTYIQKSLDYANKFVGIYDRMQNDLTQKDLSLDERAELILRQLKTKAQMDVPEIDVDLFRLPYRGSIQYYFANSYSYSLVMRSLIGPVINNVFPHFDWRDDTDSSQLHFIARDDTGYLKCFPFCINKFKKHIADLSKVIIAFQKVSSEYIAKVLAATEAILRVNEILTTAFDNNPTKLANMISELKPLEYLQYLRYKRSEIDEIFRNNDTIVANKSQIIKMIISILEPLRALGVELPIWKAKEFIVLYRNGITGEMYYKSYSASDGKIIEAIDIMQPSLNWYNAQGYFDVGAFNEQIQQIHALIRNVEFFNAEHLTDDVAYIGDTLEWIYSLLGYKDSYSTDRICKEIRNAFLRSNNHKVRILSRQMFPPPLLDVSSHRTRWNDSNKLPFYSKLYLKNLNYIRKLSNVCLGPNEGVFSLASIVWERASHEVTSYNSTVIPWKRASHEVPSCNSTVSLWERNSHEALFYDDFMKCTSPALILLERNSYEIPFYNDFMECDSPVPIVWERDSHEVLFRNDFMKCTSPAPIVWKRASHEVLFRNDFMKCNSHETQKNMLTKN